MRVSVSKFKVTYQLHFSFLLTVIRAKVVGKKLMKDGPFGTMRYTVKQMKVCLQTFHVGVHIK